MNSTELYDVEADTIYGARDLVELVLGTRLDEHDSLYRRGTYFRLGPYAEVARVMLFVNRDPFDDEPSNLDFPEARFLLYVSDGSISEILRRDLAKAGGAVRFLRSYVGGG